MTPEHAILAAAALTGACLMLLACVLALRARVRELRDENYVLREANRNLWNQRRDTKPEGPAHPVAAVRGTQ